MGRRAQRRAISHRNLSPPDGNVVFEMLMHRKRMGVDVAAAQNLVRVAQEAEIHEQMNEPDRAMHAYLELAAGALARAELTRT